MILRKYRSLLLFIIFGIISIVLGFCPINFISRQDLYIKGIYYWLSLNIYLFILTCWKVIKKNNFSFINFFKKHWFAMITSVVLVLISFFYCKPEIRIFNDELALLSVSCNLYEKKECFSSASVITNADANKEILSGLVDKRPTLFPFLVSVIHSLIGYSHNNSFILNYILGILTLFFFYFLVSFKFGRFYGLLAMICLYMHPLFVLYVNSAGFDILNLFCSLIFFLLCLIFVNASDTTTAELLLLFLPILGQSRYESILVTLITIPFVFFYLPKEKYANFSFRLFILPLLFLPIAWLRSITNFIDESVGLDFNNPFSFKYCINHIKQAIIFFFSGNKDYGVIPIISILALLGFFVFILYCLKNKKTLKSKSLIFLIISFYLIHIIVKFSFCLGDITKVLASRHALILLPLIVFLSIISLIYLNKNFQIEKRYFLIVTIILFFIYTQETTQNHAIKKMPIFRVFKFLKTYLENNHENKKDYVVIVDYPTSPVSPTILTPLGYSTVEIDILKKLENNFINYFNNKNISYLLRVNVLFSLDKPITANQLSERFVSEIIKEQKIMDDYYVVISKCYPKDSPSVELKGEKR